MSSSSLLGKAGTWVYLSMNMRALGTLWSPRWTTEEPTQLPRRCWHLCSTLCMARDTLGACCTLFRPCTCTPHASGRGRCTAYDFSRKSDQVLEEASVSSHWLGNAMSRIGCDESMSIWSMELPPHLPCVDKSV